MPSAAPTIDPLSHQRDRRPRSVAFLEATRFWLKLGCISFGGPAGQIAIMHRELVERRRWLSESRFLHALNYCMLLPGPEAQQLATYVGWLLHGVRGGLVAGGLFVLPSVLVLLVLSYVYAAHGDSGAVSGVLYGIRPMVVAIVCEAVLRIGRRAIRDRWRAVIAVAAFVAIYVVGVPFPAIVVAAAAAGWLGRRRPASAGQARSRRPTATAPADGSEPLPLVIDDHAPAPPHTRPSRARAIFILSAGAGLWSAGLLGLILVRGTASLHAQAYLFFTKAAFVTFGGAYAVLAYVAQAAAGPLGWLTPAQTVDGLALAETTPGPLIMVVQFIGFVAAWSHPEGLTPLTSALIGALATTFVTFLPSFLFIFLGAPYIEALRQNRALDASLSAVTAAVVGVILNLALVFGEAVLLPAGPAGGPDLLAAGMAAVAFAVLWRLRVPVLWLVVAGGVIGLAAGP